jgi:transcriptional regulator with XRE-family HTH domain
VKIWNNFQYFQILLELFLNYFFQMEENIVNQLISERKKRDLSVPKLAEELDIPADRIYKWEKRLGNPKGADIDKIKQWLSLEEVPNKKTIPVGESLIDIGILQKSVYNLTENELRTTSIIERLVNIIERQLGSGPSPLIPVTYDDPMTGDIDRPGHGSVSEDKRRKSGKQ